MISPQEWPQITAWFQSADRDRSGQVSLQEVSACPFGGTPLGVEAGRKLMRVFDSNRSGQIDFYEFSTLWKFVSILFGSFQQADRDRSGSLNGQEIFQALQVAQIEQLSQPTVLELFRSYNKTSAQGLRFPEFIEMAAHIIAIKSGFMEINMQQGNRGAVQVNLDQVLLMSARGV